MKTLKRNFQILFFIIFLTLFFIALHSPVAYSIDTRWLVRLNPLVGVLTIFASRTVLLSLALAAIAMTLFSALFGRVFCGFFCPLGAVIDFIDKFLFGKVNRINKRPPLYVQKLKYIILFGLIVFAAFGIVFPLFMDPISIITRVFTLLVYPLPAIAKSEINPLISALTGKGGRIFVPFFYGGYGAAILLLVIAVASFWDRRFWCQYLCPSGAFFGLVGKFAVFHRRTHHSKCGNCKICAKQCPTRAIDELDCRKTNTAECIVCGVCVGMKKECSSFTFGDSKGFVGKNAGPDIDRRNIIVGAAMGALMLPVLKTNAMNRRDNTGRLVRPPGAVPDNLFNARCTGCSQCVKACPANAIQPCTFDDGISRMSTPKIVGRIGGCEEKCYLCGQVCPTGAIRKLSYDDKRFAKIGTAVIDRHRCLAWEQNRPCLVCADMCPYKAIDSRIVETTKGPFKVPIVDESLCMGCGICEKNCPIFDTAAIVVYKFGENRRASGPYVSEARKKMILDRRNRSESETQSSPGSQ